MKVIKYNYVCFRGQFADAFEKLKKGQIITIDDFKNGSYESTSKLKRFLILLDQAKVKIEIEQNDNKSLRSTKIKIV